MRAEIDEIGHITHAENLGHSLPLHRQYRVIEDSAADTTRRQ